MAVLMISGSARESSTNRALLGVAARMLVDTEAVLYEIGDLPLFTDGREACDSVQAWRSAVVDCTSLIISTPAYLHNVPASLKSALEWLAATGELAQKPVLVIVLTPTPPRGDRAMQSLAWSLAALDARIVATLDLYLADMSVDTDGITLDQDSHVLLEAALKLL